MATIGLPLLARSINEFQLENDDHEIEIVASCSIILHLILPALRGSVPSRKLQILPLNKIGMLRKSNEVLSLIRQSGA